MKSFYPLVALVILTGCEGTSFTPSSVTGTSPYENFVRSRDARVLTKTGPASNDPKLLSVRLFASAQFVDGVDACKRPPVTHSFVAARLTPFAYCIEGTGRKSVDLQVCLEMNGSADAADLPEACWVKPSSLETFALLSNGENILRLHVRDGAGNFASDDQQVTLDPGNAPEIRLESPNQTQISNGFAKGATVKMVFQVLDNDTPMDKLKLIVQLSNRQGNGSIRPIACNFANSKSWNQCPAGSSTNAADFQIDMAQRKVTFNLTIPQDYDVTSPYVIMITAIDQSGNTAITSTGDVGSRIEVLAGRSYKGGGGSGSTIQTDGTSPLPIVDKFGNVYLMNSFEKISPFDARVCTALRVPTAPQSIADCLDVVTSDLVPATQGWGYDPAQNYFYMAARNASNLQYRLARVNFRTKVIEALSGDNTKRDISLIKYGESAAISELYVDKIEAPMFFAESTRLLYFRVSDTIFVLDEKLNARKVLGSGIADQDVGNQVQVRALDVKLPKLYLSWDQPIGFLVTNDGRIIMAADRLSTSENGRGYGRLFAVEGLNVDNPEAPVSVIDLLNRADFQILTSIIQQPLSKEILATTKWIGLRTIALPEPMTDPSTVDLQASKYVIKEGGILWSGVSSVISSFLLDEEKRTNFPLPRMVPMYVSGIAYGSSRYLYFGDGISKFLLAYDTESHRIQPLIGHVDNYNLSQNSMNIRLDFPQSIGKDAQGRIIFADRNGIRRASLDTVSLNYDIQTIYENVSEYEFSISPDGNTLVRNTDPLRFDVYDLSAAKLSPHNHRVNRIYAGGSYITHSGFLFNPDGSLLMAEAMGSWDGFRVKESAFSLYSLPRPASWSAAAIVASIKALSSADFVSTDYPRPSGNVCFNNAAIAPYQQGALAADATIDTSKFRLCGYTTGIRIGKVTAAFIDQTHIISCFVHQDFSKGRGSIAVIDTAQNKIKFTSGACNPRNSVFHIAAGKVYHGNGNSFEQVDASNYTVSSDVLVAPLANDASIRGIFVDGGYAYISDTGSDRVLKVKLK